MNWRVVLPSGVLAAGLTLTLVPRASADPPPWAGGWHYYDGDDQGYWRNGDYDRDRDIDQDRAKIRGEQRDLRRDWRQLQEERREGDWADAEAIRRDMERDERQLRHDEWDVRRDLRERREEDDED